MSEDVIDYLSTFAMAEIDYDFTMLMRRYERACERERIESRPHPVVGSNFEPEKRQSHQVWPEGAMKFYKSVPVIPPGRKQ